MCGVVFFDFVWYHTVDKKYICCAIEQNQHRFSPCKSQGFLAFLPISPLKHCLKRVVFLHILWYDVSGYYFVCLPEQKP